MREIITPFEQIYVQSHHNLLCHRMLDLKINFAFGALSFFCNIRQIRYWVLDLKCLLKLLNVN